MSDMSAEALREAKRSLAQRDSDLKVSKESVIIGNAICGMNYTTSTVTLPFPKMEQNARRRAETVERPRRKNESSDYAEVCQIGSA